MSNRLHTHRRLKHEEPTASERKVIRRGEAAFKAGDYVTLADYFRTRSGRRSSGRRRVIAFLSGA